MAKAKTVSRRRANDRAYQPVGWTLVGAGPADIVLFGEYVRRLRRKESKPHALAIPALLAKKTGRPVQMRISREEDNNIGRSRAGLHMRVRMGFRKDGRMTALDMFVVQNNGPFARAGDYNTCGVVASAAYTPINMRFRGTAVMTNTPPHGPQRGPGGTQSNVMFEPLITQAARKLGID
jgi:xanthine dehydrogenase molybdenum-binding subunit